MALPRAVDTDFHLRADGRLTQEPPSAAEQAEEFTYDPMDPVPTTGGALLMGGGLLNTDEFRPGPLDQARPSRRARTSWSSPPNCSPRTSR